MIDKVADYYALALHICVNCHVLAVSHTPVLKTPSVGITAGASEPRFIRVRPNLPSDDGCTLAISHAYGL